MKKLFEEFNPTSETEWIEKITTDLKGKSLEVLNSNPEMDLEIKAFHHKDSAKQNPSPIQKLSNSWSIRVKYNQESNSKIISDLNEGVNCLGLVFSNQEEFDKQTSEVKFEHISSDVKFDNSNDAKSFKGNSSTYLNFDVFSTGIKSGDWKFNKTEFLEFFHAHPSSKTIWIDGANYGESGATTIQELAFAANHLNEYIQLLVDANVSLEEINKKIVVELSVNDNYFINISKFRVFRNLVNLIFSAYDPDFKVSPIVVYAKTSARFLAQNDSNNNLLRQTSQAMSAVLGGCDVLTIQPTDSNEDNQINRISKNIQIILKEEAYFDKVVDPSSGAYYIENLSSEIQNKSWDLFKEIEKVGGLCTAIESETIQNYILKNTNYMVNQMNNKEKTFLGVNKFASSLEEWTNVSLPEFSNYGTFKSLNPFHLEAHYKKSNS
jgi:methylmalonyl-CoA mutase